MHSASVNFYSQYFYSHINIDIEHADNIVPISNTDEKNIRLKAKMISETKSEFNMAAG